MFPHTVSAHCCERLHRPPYRGGVAVVGNTRALWPPPKAVWLPQARQKSLATLLPGHLATEVRRPRPSLHQNHSLTSAVDDTSDEGGMGDVGCSGSASLAVPAPSAPSFSSHFSAAMVSPVWGAGHDNKPPAISTRRRGLVDVCRKIGE